MMDFDQILRPLPLLTIVPAIALYAADLRHCAATGISSSPLSGTHDSATVLSTVSLVFLSLAVVWTILWMMVLGDLCREHRIKLNWVGLTDWMLWVALVSVGSTTISMRTSKDCKVFYPGSCDPSRKNAMSAAGALTIVTA